MNILDAIIVIDECFNKEENKDSESAFNWGYIYDEISIDVVGYSGLIPAKYPCPDCGELFYCAPNSDCVPF